jgi:hypothetical protein
MSKNKADDAKKISTSFLKKHGYFKGWLSGTITWTRSGMWGENKSSVSISVSTLEGDNYLRITYTQTDRDTQEKKDFDFKIPLTTTPCRFGGKRYWFICPWYKSGVYCGKRVGTLYKDGDYFACRHCYDLTYESRNLSGYAKPFGSVISFPELEELEEKVKRKYYRGQPTKRYLRFLKKEEKATRSMIGIVRALEGRAKRFSRKY